MLYGGIGVVALVSGALLLPDLPLAQALGVGLIGGAGWSFAHVALTVLKRRAPARFDALWEGV